MVAESLFKRCERWLSGAVTGGNVFDFEPMMQCRDNPLDVRIGRYSEMKAASDEVNPRINRSCGFNDLVNAGMRTTNHEDQSLRGVDDERELAQFERTRLIGDECN